MDRGEKGDFVAVAERVVRRLVVEADGGEGGAADVSEPRMALAHGFEEVRQAGHGGQFETFVVGTGEITEPGPIPDGDTHAVRPARAPLRGEAVAGTGAPWKISGLRTPMKGRFR